MNLTLCIVKKTAFPINSLKNRIDMGFLKIGKDLYSCYVVEKKQLENELIFKMTLIVEENFRLGENFKEDEFNPDMKSSFEISLGRMPKKVEISKFYNITKGAISQWSKETIEVKALHMKLKQSGFELQK